MKIGCEKEVKTISAETEIRATESNQLRFILNPDVKQHRGQASTWMGDRLRTPGAAGMGSVINSA